VVRRRLRAVWVVTGVVEEIDDGRRPVVDWAGWLYAIRCLRKVT
jgi:hypothetical protein